jgi:hypothetical protein
VASVGIAFATLAAILGSGEHYLVDAVVSMPLLLSLLAAVMPSLARTVRIWCCAGGGLLTIAWLLAFRFGVALALSDAARIAVSVVTAAIGIGGVFLLHRLSFRPASIHETPVPVTAYERAAATFSEPEPS